MRNAFRFFIFALLVITSSAQTPSTPTNGQYLFTRKKATAGTEAWPITLSSGRVMSVDGSNQPTALDVVTEAEWSTRVPSPFGALAFQTYIGPQNLGTNVVNGQTLKSYPVMDDSVLVEQAAGGFRKVPAYALGGLAAVDWRLHKFSNYSTHTSVSSISGVTDGLSGASFSLRTGNVFAIRNVSGDAGHTYELTVDGLLLRTITNSNFVDTEAVKWVGYDVDNTSDILLVAEENNEQRLSLVKLGVGSSTLDRTAAGNVSVTTHYSGGTINNLGLEAIAYDSLRGRVYYTVEKQTNTAGTANGTSAAVIYYRTVTWPTLAFGPETQLFSINALFSGTLSDIADMEYDRSTDTLVLLSQESTKVVRVSLADGTFIESSGVAGVQPEGLAFNADASEMWIVGEPQEFYRLGINGAPALDRRRPNMVVGPYTLAPRATLDVYGTTILGSAGTAMSRVRHGTVALVGGTATVSDTNTTANTRVFLTSQVDGGTPGWLRVSGRSANTSFTITSSSGSDTSTVAWMAIEP